MNKALQAFHNIDQGAFTVVDMSQKTLTLYCTNTKTFKLSQFSQCKCRHTLNEYQ